MPRNVQKANVQKTLTDVGYIAVGLGVMGFQQAQVRARSARTHVSNAGDCLSARARKARHALDSQTQTARAQAETQVRNTVTRANAQATALRDELGKRVEPVVGQVQAQLGELPERVVQAMEPVAARVRELTGNAA
jgi:hypothetical protein